MRICWLASYPKSGNTWLRLLLANLDREEPVAINELDVGTIASARWLFDEAMLFPAGLLTHDEGERMRPLVYADLAATLAAGSERARFIKTHDAWTTTPAGDLLGAGDGAVLIVRDPRGVAASFANHNDSELGATIDIMGRADNALCAREDRLPNQLRQRLLGWSGFNASWLDQRVLPIHVVSYEAMQRDTAGALAGVLEFAGIRATGEQIARAVRFADFAAIRAQEEKAGGFREAPRRLRDRRFFRNGTADGWRGELSPDQVRRIEEDHWRVMARLGYAANGAPGE